MGKMLIWMLDPAAFTLPYERPLMTALLHHGVEVQLITSRSIYDKTPPHAYEIEFYFRLLNTFTFLNHFSKVRRAARGVHYLFDQWRLTRRIQQQKPAILHVHWALLPLIDRWVWQRWKMCKLVFTLHDIIPNHLPFGAAKPYFALYRQADKLILHSLHNREAFLRLGHQFFPTENWESQQV